VQDFAHVGEWYPGLTGVLGSHGAYVLVNFGRVAGALFTPVNFHEMAVLGFRGAWAAMRQRASLANVWRALHAGWAGYGVKAGRAGVGMLALLHGLSGMRRPVRPGRGLLLGPGPGTPGVAVWAGLAEPLVVPVVVVLPGGRLVVGVPVEGRPVVGGRRWDRMLAVLEKLPKGEFEELFAQADCFLRPLMGLAPVVLGRDVRSVAVRDVRVAALVVVAHVLHRHGPVAAQALARAVAGEFGGVPRWGGLAGGARLRRERGESSRLGDLPRLEEQGVRAREVGGAGVISASSADAAARRSPESVNLGSDAAPPAAFDEFGETAFAETTGGLSGMAADATSAAAPSAAAAAPGAVAPSGRGVLPRSGPGGGAGPQWVDVLGGPGTLPVRGESSQAGWRGYADVLYEVGVPAPPPLSGDAGLYPDLPELPPAHSSDIHDILNLLTAHNTSHIDHPYAPDTAPDPIPDPIEAARTAQPEGEHLPAPQVAEHGAPAPALAHSPPQHESSLPSPELTEQAEEDGHLGLEHLGRTAAEPPAATLTPAAPTRRPRPARTVPGPSRLPRTYPAPPAGWLEKLRRGLEKHGSEVNAKRLADALRPYIETFKPDTLLLPQKRLAQHLGTRPRIGQDAYEQLITEGLLITEPSIGTLVAPRESEAGPSHLGASDWVEELRLDLEESGATITTRRLAVALRPYIGAFEPDTVLPSQERLAQALEIGPDIVGKAYRQLVTEDLLITVMGAGTRVAPRQAPQTSQVARLEAGHLAPPAGWLEELRRDLEEGGATVSAQRLADVLRTHINYGLLPPETDLPTEGKLAQHLEITELAVHDAYKHLAAERLLIIKPGKGVWVRGLHTELPDWLPALRDELRNASELRTVKLLARALRTRIEDGRLMPGTLLPAVQKQASYLGVSERTVCRAYKLLSAKHVLVTKGSRGTRVTPRVLWDPAAASRAPYWVVKLCRELWDGRRVNAKRLARALRTRIVEERLKPEAFLPSYRELAQHLGIKDVTAHRAYALLTAERLLIRVQVTGQGHRMRIVPRERWDPAVASEAPRAVRAAQREAQPASRPALTGRPAALGVRGEPVGEVTGGARDPGPTTGPVDAAGAVPPRRKRARPVIDPGEGQAAKKARRAVAEPPRQSSGPSRPQPLGEVSHTMPKPPRFRSLLDVCGQPDGSQAPALDRTQPEN
jgi:DNA-binding GntR family transcriptional regulator